MSVLEGDEWKYVKCTEQSKPRAQLQSEVDDDYALGKIDLAAWHRKTRILSGEREAPAPE